MSLSSSLQTIFLLLTILLAYIWLSVPVLSSYSLQIFTLTTIIYFIIKRINKSHPLHIAPANMSFEIILASFAFLMLIGATGNKDSIFYPLTYVHLFFLVFATKPSTAIIVTGALMWFHYALGTELDMTEIADLLTLPIILSFFLFAKSQYQEAIQKTFQLEKEDQLLKQESIEVNDFIDDFLKPKLASLKNNLVKTDQLAADQVDQINKEVKILENHIDQYSAQTQIQDDTPTE